jgi:hypothetical protein
MGQSGFGPPAFEPATFDFIKSRAFSDLNTLGHCNDSQPGKVCRFCE